MHEEVEGDGGHVQQGGLLSGAMGDKSHVKGKEGELQMDWFDAIGGGSIVFGIGPLLSLEMEIDSAKGVQVQIRGPKTGKINSICYFMPPHF